MEQQVNIVLESVRVFMIELGQFLPKVIGAVLILVIGWLIAKLLQFVVARGLKTIGFGVITDKAGLDGFLKKGGVKKNTIDVLAQLVYWLAILVTLLTTFNSLGLTVVSELFARVTEFIPNVSDAITTYTRNVGMEDSPLIGRVTYYGIAVFVAIITLGQMRIADGILYPALLIVIGGVVLALALAFGLGGQKWAAGQLDKWNKTK
jgi:hypothetical protein